MRGGFVFLSFIFGCFALFSSTSAYEFLYDQNLSDHPLYRLPAFADFTPRPVIVKRYAHIAGSKPDTRYMVFRPGVGTFKKFESDDYYFQGLDLLSTVLNFDQTTSDFVTFELNEPARVIILLSGRDLGRRFFRDLAGSHPAEWAIRGLPDGFDPEPVLVEPAIDRDSLPPYENGPQDIGDVKTHGQALAFHVTVPSDLKMTLPHPGSISVNGQPGSLFTILFAELGEKSDPIVPFPSPPLPPPFLSHTTPGEIVDPSTDVPRANAYCPEWVHDLYVTETRGDGTDQDEPLYWRTWHPYVDPVYWCYFKHEHGSYPGWYYKPQFGYQAWKTPDETTSHGRQEETHNGFKVFTLLPQGSETRVVVITVHMHLSQKRRFTARLHTVILAVLSADGELEAEVSHKFDFGALITQLEEGGSVPIDDAQAEIEDQLKDAGRRGSRRINIMNIDDSFPDSVDPRFQTRLADNPEDVKGIYEQWRGIFANCVDNQGDSKAELNFDVLDPATAMRYFGDYDQMSVLKGSSINRFLDIRSFIFTRDSCQFEGGMPHDDVFYTNPYFTSLEDGPGPNSVKQYIKRDFVPLIFPSGRMSLDGFWNAPYIPSNDIKQAINIDGAIDKMVN